MYSKRFRKISKFSHVFKKKTNNRFVIRAYTIKCYLDFIRFQNGSKDLFVKFVMNIYFFGWDFGEIRLWDKVRRQQLFFETLQ